ncbi:unnamed protein product [Blepharisma stoltei]|uniref:Uncharacterized protein n=1 Tax=Blepharisma stoltei TaxID=1481888 RepID=A0AAU9IG75_9CILI|nr:unnamed protein product [Blepharisma stoltei]
MATFPSPISKCHAILTSCLIFLLYVLASLLLCPQTTRIVPELDTQIENAYISNHVTLSNKNFKKAFTPKPFSINDTDQMLMMKQIIPAIPASFGYTIEEAEILFPKYEYPRCDTLYEDRNKDIEVNLSNNKFEIKNCTGGKFLVGPPKPKLYTSPKLGKKHWNVKKYTKKNAKLQPHTEFIMGLCNPESDHFDTFFTTPRFNAQAYSNAIDTMKSFKTESKLDKKPLLIATITLDSFSRRHFFRKLPTTISYLNSLEMSAAWKVYDFKFHNIIGASTLENQSTFLGNNSIESYPLTDSRLGRHALWKKLQRMGFMTLLGMEMCAYKLNTFFGPFPDADHVVQPFYCAAKDFAGYSSSKFKAKNIRCLGPQMSHWYLMDYSLRFAEMYSQTSLWIYNHFTAAHEITGQHAQTIDEDLTWYLKKLAKFENTHNVVFMIVGDHGMRYAGFKSKPNSMQEHRLPVFFLAAKRELLDRIPNSYDTLEHNTYRLTTKPDLRRTVIYLAGELYGKTLNPDSRYFNLFNEKVPNNRTCNDAGIPPWLCSTYYLKNIDMQALDKAETKFLQTVAEEVINTINSNSYSSKIHDKGILCRKVTLKLINSASSTEAESNTMIYKIQLEINESDAVFDAWTYVSPYETSLLDSDKALHTFPVIHKSQKMIGKISQIYRIDSYGGKCEDASRSLGFNAEFCICNSDLLELYDSE